MNKAVEITANESQALAKFIEQLHADIKGNVGGLSSGDIVLI